MTEKEYATELAELGGVGCLHSGADTDADTIPSFRSQPIPDLIALHIGAQIIARLMESGTT